MCLCWWGKGEGGVSLQILILLNFINIAERRSFFAALQASDVQTIYVMLIEKNRPVERSVVIIAYDAQLHTAAKTSLFWSKLELKLMMNVGFDFTSILCADPLLPTGSNHCRRPIYTRRHAERGGQKGSSPGGPETQRGPGFRIVKIECKTTAYGRH